ncbi:MAG: hypothetical protein M1823_004401 [Watsoniomyces obsoletus]|nr:MAG: hypothetical protein M1823_004401 [Watsoniomyces obsoletus]
MSDKTPKAAEKSPTKAAEKTEKGDKSEKGDKVEGVAGMNDGDLKFMAECFRNSTGALAIDFEAVADALGLKNPRSVSNRMSAIRKKYGLNINTTTGKSGAAAAAGTAGGIIGNDGKVAKKPSTPRTPRTKDTPKKTPSGSRRKSEATTPTKRGRKAVKAQEDEEMVDAEDNVKDEDEDMDEDAGGESDNEMVTDSKKAITEKDAEAEEEDDDDE